MRKYGSALATAALMLLPLIGFGRAAAWFVGPYSSQRSLAVIRDAAPERAPVDDYISSRECRSCHPGQYQSWHDSYHRRMTQLATPEAVVADFDDVELSWLPPAAAPEGQRRRLHFRLSRRADEYWVSQRSPNPEEPELATRIVMTTGSHHHQVVWVSGEDGRLMNFPFTYLIAEKRWIPLEDSFLSPPDDPFGVVYWSDVCIECHSVQGRPRVAAGKLGDDSQVAELGIACEACHGPGGPHVAANRLPWQRYSQRGREDPTIVNPEHLSARRASQVCGRCHSVLSYPGIADNWNGRWNDYRPGEELESEGRLLLHPESGDLAQRKAFAAHERAHGGRFERERFWSDGAVRLTGRELGDVMTSPCFEGGEFSCLSCHSMHDYESPANQLAPEMAGDRACLQCHGDFAGDPSGHTKHAADSAGSRCTNCHMPYTSYGLRKGIRSHRVSSPSIAAELATGRPNACNICHLDRSLRWTQEQLATQFGAPRVSLERAEYQIAEGPRWIATGDAGVRALAAFYMGWEPARQASGAQWMAPYLAELLADRYSAVRSLAHRSLRTLPGFEDMKYDFVEARGRIGNAARIQMQTRWLQEREGREGRIPGPLIGADGKLDHTAWALLVAGRDTRPIALSE